MSRDDKKFATVSLNFMELRQRLRDGGIELTDPELRDLCSAYEEELVAAGQRAMFDLFLTAVSRYLKVRKKPDEEKASQES